MPDYAANLRRLMARQGYTQAQLARRSELDERTVKGILSGACSRPHPRTLFKLAAGLEVAVDELFQNPGSLSHRSFDRQTNPVVTEVVARHPERFADWDREDFDDLYSRFGTGGPLTAEGVLAVASVMQDRREIHRRVDLLLETHEAELLKTLVAALFQRIGVPPSSTHPPDGR